MCGMKVVDCGWTLEAQRRTFGGMHFKQMLVTGHAQGLRDVSGSHFHDTVEALSKSANNGERVQVEIDRYMLHMYMYAVRSPLLDRGPPEMFVTDAAHVLTTLSLPDIGRFISKLVTGHQNSSHDLMSRLIHYSMPYIKHNRMNFPPFCPEHAAVLPDIVNIILASCLGLFPECNKKPVLGLRIQLISFFHTLKARGSPLDLYVFCTANMCLLRIAMIEYFVFFISSYMPNETLMLRQVFGLHQDIHDIFRQFIVICDTFRHLSLQTSVLDMTEINLKAQIAIDKCNRVCKGKSRSSSAAAPRSAAAPLLPDVVALALRTPVLAHISYTVLAHPALSIAEAHRVKTVHDYVGLHELPSNIRRAQIAKIRKILHNDTLNTINTISMKICMKCVLGGRVVLDPVMRVMASGQSSCTVCKHDSRVVSICTVGRIVRIHCTSFYYCVFCMRVHLWRSTGTEFMCCALAAARPRALSPLACCVCGVKSNTVACIRVLDDELGVMQDVPLCHRHMPQEHVLRWVDNLAQLRDAVARKYTKLAPRH